MAAASAEFVAQPTLPGAELVERFRRTLDPLVPPSSPIGIAVSGGPDSLALLLLAAAARPGQVEAATVDHALRPEAGAEAERVAAWCAQLGIPHRILTAEWPTPVQTGVQQRARGARYRLLAEWAAERQLKALVTAHHLDDQAETLLMRLTRGSGVRGLGAMRRLGRTPGAAELPLLRPLLGWRSAELRALCGSAGIVPVDDPSNRDARFERARLRTGMAEAEWIDPVGLAASAAHLGEADAALDWAAARVWRRAVRRDGEQLLFQPRAIPRELRRRVLARAVTKLASEGAGRPIRGRELDILLGALAAGRKATLRGVQCSGGALWTFAPAPTRAA